MAVYLAYCLAFCGYGALSNPRQADVCVVLGNTVNPDGTLSRRLEQRLQAGIQVFNSGLCSKIIVSGGLGKEGHNEAEVMAQHLSNIGIPASAIIVDTEGVNTKATAQFTMRYCREHKLKSVIAVSQYYHVLRTKLALQNEGGRKITVSAPFYFEFLDFYSVPRESLALPYYFFRDLGKRN